MTYAMRSQPQTEKKMSERLNEKIAMRFIELAAKGIMLPTSDTAIKDRHEDYKDIHEGPVSKWVAAEVYAFLRGFQMSGRIKREAKNAA